MQTTDALMPHVACAGEWWEGGQRYHHAELRSAHLYVQAGPSQSLCFWHRYFQALPK